MYSIAYGKAMPVPPFKRWIIGYYRNYLCAFLIILLLLPSSLFAQTPGSISLSFKNAPLSQVIREIEQQSGYRFFYNETLIGKGKPVTIETKGATLEKALALCFANQPFTYSIVSQTVVIKEKKVQESLHFLFFNDHRFSNRGH